MSDCDNGRWSLTSPSRRRMTRADRRPRPGTARPRPRRPRPPPDATCPCREGRTAAPGSTDDGRLRHTDHGRPAYHQRHHHPFHNVMHERRYLHFTFTFNNLHLENFFIQKWSEVKKSKHGRRPYLNTKKCVVYKSKFRAKYVEINITAIEK